MTSPRRYSRDEIGRLGDDIYERSVLPHLGSEDQGKFALIDVETGDYEVDLFDPELGLTIRSLPWSVYSFGRSTGILERPCLR
jgi:hypothetical protein